MEYGERAERIRQVFRGVVIVAVVLIVIVGVALFLSVATVSVGYVAVVVDPISGTLGTQGDGATARYFLKPPWASVVPIYVATDSVNMWTDIDPTTGRGISGDFPAVPTLTRDGLGVEVDVTVRWNLAPSQAKELYQRFPAGDWKERAIIPIVRRVIRDTIVGFTAIETIEKRGAVGAELEATLGMELEREPSLVGAIVLGTIDLREIALPSGFIGAIEAKLAAEQLAIAAEFNRTRILVEANATAQSAIIAAEGVATSRVIVANATYESIKIISGESNMNSTQLTNLFLTLEALKEIAKTGRTTFLIVTGEEGTWILPIPEPTS